MKTNWEPGDVRTGLLVVGAFATLVGAVIWAKSSGSSDLAPLYAEFPTLSAVTAETPVTLNGFKVGHVDEVVPKIDAMGHLSFRVRMSVLWHPGGPGTPVPYRIGTRVELATPAIDVFGTPTLKLEPPAEQGGELPKGATLPLVKKVTVMETAQGRIDSLSNEMARTLSDTRRLLGVLVQTASAATQTAQAATKAAGATAGVLGTANEQMVALATDTRARMLTADSLMRDMRTLTPSAKATADSLQGLLGDSRKALARLTHMADANEPQITRAIASLDSTSLLLQHFMREISARPMRVLTGVSPLPAGPAPEKRPSPP